MVMNKEVECADMWYWVVVGNDLEHPLDAFPFV
jgi:hypothetical protein